MLTCFISLCTTYCTGMEGFHKLECKIGSEMSVTDTIFGMWEIAVKQTMFTLETEAEPTNNGSSSNLYLKSGLYTLTNNIRSFYSPTNLVHRLTILITISTIQYNILFQLGSLKGQ